jgi:hypothetical protein
MVASRYAASDACRPPSEKESGVRLSIDMTFVGRLGSVDRIGLCIGVRGVSGNIGEEDGGSVSR